MMKWIDKLIAILATNNATGRFRQIGLCKNEDRNMSKSQSLKRNNGRTVTPACIPPEPMTHKMRVRER